MLTICLPEYNEGEVLFEFVDKLNKEFGNAIMVIVDDHSPEQFQYDVKAKYGNLENFILIFNSQNLGHGQSTLIGLNKAIETENEIIIAVDGDGQFKTEEIKKLYQSLVADDSIEVIEGTRTNRDEEWFRKVISFSTRIMIYIKCGKFPKDANTPLRIYRRETLKSLLSEIPPDSLIPNLHISSVTRIKKFNFKEVSVQSLPRGGGLKNENMKSITWSQKIKNLPSRRLLKFCVRAVVEWIKS